MKNFQKHSHKTQLHTKWWFWLILTLLFLVCIQILFTIKAPCIWLEATWEAGDLISIVGTLTLGFISIKQSEKANAMSMQLMYIEKERHKLEVRPFVMITDWSADIVKDTKILYNFSDKKYIQVGDWESPQEALALSLKFQNTTGSTLTLQYYSGSHFTTNCKINLSNPKLILGPGESGEFSFFATPEFLSKLAGKTIQWDFLLENRFYEKYHETFNTIVMSLRQAPTNTSKWFCILDVNDVTISKS